ncbi:hypothetical protein V6N12_074297 [Hibiscus sabdariffa]|uniref:Uncharacterized protein n=1 Tax=Hibiscus sabdariffa TaxID=183260 RepID=A0ABR2BL04_9ROSI
MASLPLHSKFSPLFNRGFQLQPPPNAGHPLCLTSSHLHPTLCSLVVILFLFASKIQASGRGVSTEHSTSRQPRQHVFGPWSSTTSPPFKDQPSSHFGEEKRRVPTGSNPLHNR